MALYLLFESAAGYVLFLVEEFDQIAVESEEFQQSLLDAKLFGKTVKLVSIFPFPHAEDALSNMNAITAGEVTPDLLGFLEMNLPKKKRTYQIGIADTVLGKALSDNGFPALYDKNVLELLRGCRMHLSKLAKKLDRVNLERARVGLGHSYSRMKMKYDPMRQDKPVIHSIALIDGLDKSINLFAMRVKEWYSWHFPELAKIVTDGITFAKVASVIRLRDTFDPVARREDLVEVVLDEAVADEIIAAMKTSMGQEVVEADMVNIDAFASEVIKLSDQRKHLSEFLGNKLDIVAPNLKALLGDTVAARLIAHAGSLVTLAKYPSSTVQILGAEKALFRALKSKGNTPKYGLLFQSAFIGKATAKNKGRISRYLANKCSMAARIDSFAPVSSSLYGDALRAQVEERLAFLTEGSAPRKNLDVMKKAMEEYEQLVGESLVPKKKKRKTKELEDEADEPMADAPMDTPKKKKKRKSTAEE